MLMQGSCRPILGKNLRRAWRRSECSAPATTLGASASNSAAAAIGGIAFLRVVVAGAAASPVRTRAQLAPGDRRAGPPAVSTNQANQRWLRG
eukprot:1490205-Prymnesium_polylepis.1